MMEVAVIKSNSNFTPYKFYTEFLEDVAEFYSNGNKDIFFRLFEKGDSDFNAEYRIDPIVIPLLLSLFEQLSKFHKKEIPVLLNNNPSTISVLEFLYRCDFFYVGGNNKNPTFPIGKRVISFNETYLGAFRQKLIRRDHKLRVYSLADDGLNNSIQSYRSEEEKRDFLISHYTYKVQEHFHELLSDNTSTLQLHNTYIDILSELIANAVLHSKSNAFVLMFVDRFKTKFSISDNGIGLEISMQQKHALIYYTPNEFKNQLEKICDLPKISPSILKNLHVIFETLYYSSLKDRKGLFDLMISSVLKCQGYFRLHFENCQILVSNRMKDDLIRLDKVRNEIYSTHVKFNLGQIKEDDWKNSIISKSSEILMEFTKFFKHMEKKYSDDIVFSSLRFYKVKFRGVHIEVEIPNSFEA